MYLCIYERKGRLGYLRKIICVIIDKVILNKIDLSVITNPNNFINLL